MLISKGQRMENVESAVDNLSRFVSLVFRSPDLDFFKMNATFAEKGQRIKIVQSAKIP